MVNLGASPVARTVSFTRANASSINPDATFSTILPSLKNIEEKNNFQDRLISQEQIQLNTISLKLNDFTFQLNDINETLKKISSLMLEDSSLESFQQKEKERKDFILSQNEIRTERENLIERKLESALIKPVEAINKKAQGALLNVGKFFGTLFLGWLTNQGIAAFQANAEGARNRLEEIKNNVISALGSVYKIIRLFYGGIQTIISTVTSITAKITKFLLIDVIGGLFKKLGDLGKAVIQGARNLLPKPPPTPPASTAKVATEAAETTATKATQETAEVAGRTATKAATETAERRGGNLIGRLIPGFGTALNLGIAGYRFNAGDPTGGFLSLGQALPGIFGVPFLAADIARDFGMWDKKKEEENIKTQPKVTKTPEIIPKQLPKLNEPQQQQPQQPQQPETTNTKSIIEPTEPIIKKSPTSTSVTTQSGTVSTQIDTNLNFSLFGKTAASETTEQTQVDFSKPATYGTVTGNIQSISNEVNYSEQRPPVVPLKIESLKPKEPQKVGPLPEPKPNIIITSIPQQQKPQISVTPSTKGLATRVPSIPSSNPDNFYSLYSQVTYGVVI